MAFNFNGSILVTCGDNGFKAWNTDTWNNIQTSSNFSKSINNIAFSKTNLDLFAVANLDFQTRIIRINSIRQN